MGERVCIFCGRAPVTREHIFRKKLAEYVDNPRERVSRPGEDPDRSPLVFERTVRRVCGACNNGWMNDLENAVEPVLINLIQARETVLKTADAMLLAKWAVKTAIIRSFMDNDRSLSATETSYLYEHQKPRASWFVVLGRTYTPALLDQTRHFRGHSSASVASRGGDSNVHVQQHVLNIGEMLLISTSLVGPPEVVQRPREVLRRIFLDQQEYPFVELFPTPRTAEWPVAESLTGEQMGDIIQIVPDMYEVLTGQIWDEEH